MRPDSLKTLTYISYKKKKGVALRNKIKEERRPCGGKANKNKKGLRKCYNKKDHEWTNDNDWA